METILIQSSKNKIQISLSFTFLFFILGSNLSQVASFPTTYSFTGCSSSKNYLCLEDSRQSFSQMSLISETKKLRTHTHNHLFSSAFERYDFRKKEIDEKRLKINKFYLTLKMRKLISDAKQLRANNFIKSFWQLIISTSNATLEVSSLRVLLTYSLYLTLSLRMKPFGVFPDYFSLDHFLVTSYCF